ncbi:MAG: sigma-70 family RNA polymerase sigma factor [Oscillospiraceae bacterium]|nr:sigma-70 family RNA polymerase sigma factor [Oscillospiraceae bacterium]
MCRLEENELEDAIGSFVSQLPRTEKTIFVLRYWYVTPIEEIAEKLQFSKGKIKSVLFRTRKKLRVFLQEEGLC